MMVLIRDIHTYMYIYKMEGNTYIYIYMERERERKKRERERELDGAKLNQQPFHWTVPPCRFALNENIFGGWIHICPARWWSHLCLLVYNPQEYYSFIYYIPNLLELSSLT